MLDSGFVKINKIKNFNQVLKYLLDLGYNKTQLYKEFHISNFKLQKIKTGKIKRILKLNSKNETIKEFKRAYLNLTLLHKLEEKDLDDLIIELDSYAELVQVHRMTKLSSFDPVLLLQMREDIKVMKLVEFSKKYNVAITTAAGIRDRFNIKHSVKVRLNDSKKKAILKDIKETNLSYRKLGKKHGVSFITVNRLAKRHGLRQ